MRDIIWQVVFGAQPKRSFAKLKAKVIPLGLPSTSPVGGEGAVLSAMVMGGGVE